MSEKEIKEPHRIDRGLVHPAVAMAVQMAEACSGRAGAITKAEFQHLFHGVSHPGHWAELGVNMRTAALMMATALQYRSVIETRAGVTFATDATDPAAAPACEHASAVMETVRSLSTLADQFGGAPAF